MTTVLARCGGLIMTAAISVITGVGVANAQPSSALAVQHAAARLVVVAERGNDVALSISHGPSRLPPLLIRREGGRLVVDGGLGEAGLAAPQCVGGRSVGPAGGLFGVGVTHVRDDRGVKVAGIGRVEWTDLPVITAHVPLDAILSTQGAVWSEVGATRALSLTTTGCGDATAGPVAAALGVDAVGSGDVKVQSAGSAQLKLTGSGDVTVGRIGGPAQLDLAGSGDIRTGNISGPVALQLSGSGDVEVAAVDGPIHSGVSASGDVRIHGGHAAELQVALSGSGSFAFGGTADRVEAALNGSGDITIAHASGPVGRTVRGSGDIRIGR